MQRVYMKLVLHEAIYKNTGVLVVVKTVFVTNQIIFIKL